MTADISLENLNTREGRYSENNYFPRRHLVPKRTSSSQQTTEGVRISKDIAFLMEMRDMPPLTEEDRSLDRPPQTLEQDDKVIAISDLFGRVKVRYLIKSIYEDASAQDLSAKPIVLYLIRRDIECLASPANVIFGCIAEGVRRNKNGQLIIHPAGIYHSDKFREFVFEEGTGKRIKNPEYESADLLLGRNGL